MARHTRLPVATKSKARRLRKEMTEAETCLWQHLRQHQFSGYKFRRQHPVGRYIADFICLEARLMIELDGGQHVDQSGYDQARTEWLESKGYRVVRFWNNDVLRNIENVKDAIWQTLHTNAQPPSQPSPCQGEGAGGPRFA